MRTIGVVTAGRSDYGIYLPLLRCIQADPRLGLQVLVTGMHLAPEFGMTVKVIEGDGFEIAERVEMLLASDSPEGVAKSIGLGVQGFAQAFTHCRPDILMVLGDRFEMYAAAVAALPFKIPVAHIHGGEVTQGAIDDALRHSMTKLSHLHFVSTEVYARRVRQLGEAPWRVTVVGAPSLDNLSQMPWLTRPDIEKRFGVRLPDQFLLVTYHPVTLEYERTAEQLGELLMALAIINLPVVFTLPNADTSGHVIRERITAYVQTHPTAQQVENLGTVGYFNLMALATAMVGNSSSGLIEAPSLGLPVVNIGTRQAGRVRGANVIDTGYARAEIQAAVRRALDPALRVSLRQAVNPYGNGQASERIVARLKAEALDDRLLIKEFCDLPNAV